MSGRRQVDAMRFHCILGIFPNMSVSFPAVEEGVLMHNHAFMAVRHVVRMHKGYNQK